MISVSCLLAMRSSVHINSQLGSWIIGDIVILGFYVVALMEKDVNFLSSNSNTVRYNTVHIHYLAVSAGQESVCRHDLTVFWPQGLTWLSVCCAMVSLLNGE